MKKLIVATLFVGVLIISFLYWRNYDDRILISRGNAIVQNIETYKQEKGRLPNSLDELGIYDDDLFYNKWDSINYMLWYGTSLGESVIYYSDTKKWEDKQRGFE